MVARDQDVISVVARGADHPEPICVRGPGMLVGKTFAMDLVMAIAIDHDEVRLRALGLFREQAMAYLLVQRI